MVTEIVNEQQRRAVEHTTGPLRIMAGAGTGKTSTLKNRIVHLIGQGLAEPAEILALTFTNKAVDELRDRVDEALSAQLTAGERVDIDTYHAFGGRIVNDFGSRLGFPSDPVVLTPAESWIILWQGVDEIGFEHIDLGNLRGGLGPSPLARILELGSRLSDEMRTIENLEVWLEGADANTKNNDLRDFARALRYYQKRKLELGVIDYGDQIVMACTLLAEPDIAATIGRRYRIVMVDEFQDTNYAQSLLVQRLTGGLHDNVCVVGDPNQAIYAFRGAAPDNLERFAGDSFPGALTLPLSDNYRSTQEILDLANSIWGESDNVPYRGNLRTALGSHGPRPLLVEAEHLDDEMAFIPRQILELSESGWSFRQMAVLCRKGVTKRLVYDVLRAHGIPAEIVGGQSLYETPEVREIISWLRAIGDPGNDAAFAFLLLSERCGMDERMLYDVSQHRRKGESLQEMARRLVAEGTAPRDLVELVTTLSRLVQRSYAGLEPLLAAIVDLREGASDVVEAENIDRFASVVLTFASSRLGSPDLQDLLAYLELMLIAGAEEEAATEFDPDEASGVTVITAHAAKGLQWPVVFVPCANYNDFYNQGRRRTEVLPWDLSHPEPGRPVRTEYPEDAKGEKAYGKAVEEWQKAQARQEEYRALYVALTRAESLLYVSWAKENPTRMKPSAIHPALVEASALCQNQLAPSAANAPAPMTLGDIAPQMIERLAPFLAGASAGTGPGSMSIAGTGPGSTSIAGTLPGSTSGLEPALAALSEEAGLAEEVLLDAWRQFELDWDRMTHQVAEFALASTAGTVLSGDDSELFFVSFTSLGSWDHCPHQYYLHYVRRLPGEPKRWATGYGSALHKVLQQEAERRLIGRRTSGDELRAALAADPESGSGFGGQEHADPVEAYLRAPDATAEVLMVEQPFTLRFGDVAISGVIDRVHRLPDGSTEVVDYKTSKNAATLEQIRGGLQLPIYLIACREIFSEIEPPPDRAVLFNLRHNVRTEVTWTQTELDGVRDRVITMASNMRTADGTSHKASPKTCTWCEYRFNCRFSQYRGS